MAKYAQKARNAAPKRRPRQSRVTRVLAGIAAGMAVLTAGMTWGAVAKYTHQSQRTGLVRAKEFYFTSDYLMPTSNTVYTLNGDDSVTFELRNYDGLLKSELDITYEVSVSGGATLTLNGDGKLTRDEEKESVTVSGMTPGNSYTVTAVGRNGYEKTLYATFTVKKPNEGIFYNTKRVGDYVLVTVWTENATASDIVVSVPDGFIPDATDKALETYTAGTGTVSMADLGAYQSRSYRFFTAGGDINAITVTAGGTPVNKETELN